LDLIHSFVYGILQGVFAYIPVSSDAQIRLFQVLAGWQGDESPKFTAFTAVIQVGPTLAVILFLRKEVMQALRGFVDAVTRKNLGSHDAKVGMAVFWGTLPIVILGYALQKRIETDFRSLYVIAISLILGAILMYVADNSKREQRTEADIQPKDGIIVGLWQCLALIPGMSRSGSTIAGALLQRFKRPDAARFAFLLGIPSFTAAGILELVKHRHELSDVKIPLALAFVVSFVVAYGCLAWFLAFLQKRGFLPFIVYRVVVGLIILGLLVSHKIEPGGAKPSEANKVTFGNSRVP
jgi:undecaprenyl-diphosphatase